MDEQGSQGLMVIQDLTVDRAETGGLREEREEAVGFSSQRFAASTWQLRQIRWFLFAVYLRHQSQHRR